MIGFQDLPSDRCAPTHADVNTRTPRCRFLRELRQSSPLARFRRAAVVGPSVWPGAGRSFKTRHRFAFSQRPQRGIQAPPDSVDVLQQWTNAECGLGVCGTDDGFPMAPSLS